MDINRIALRYLFAGAFQHDYQRFKGHFEETYQTLTRQYPNLKNALQYPPTLTSAFMTYLSGRDLSHAALREKDVPVRRIKKFEKAYREVNRKRRPKCFTTWFIKNLESLKILLESNSWPEHGSSETRFFTHGPFKVHNQTGEEPDASVKILQASHDLMSRSGIPHIRSVLYGNIFIVGNIRRKRTEAALYDPSQDQIYLLLVNRFSGKHTHALVHEFGHRYWKLNLVDKKRWVEHHTFLARFDPGITFPEVGDPVRGVKGNPRVERYEGDKIYLEGGGYIKTMSYAAHMKKIERMERFPTPYASRDPEEHFCEAFALYCHGELKDLHKVSFEGIVKGK